MMAASSEGKKTYIEAPGSLSNQELLTLCRDIANPFNSSLFAEWISESKKDREEGQKEYNKPGVLPLTDIEYAPGLLLELAKRYLEGKPAKSSEDIDLVPDFNLAEKYVDLAKAIASGPITDFKEEFKAPTPLPTYSGDEQIIKDIKKIKKTYKDNIKKNESYIEVTAEEYKKVAEAEGFLRQIDYKRLTPAVEKKMQEATNYINLIKCREIKKPPESLGTLEGPIVEHTGRDANISDAIGKIHLSHLAVDDKKFLLTLLINDIESIRPEYDKLKGFDNPRDPANRRGAYEDRINTINKLSAAVKNAIDSGLSEGKTALEICKDIQKCLEKAKKETPYFGWSKLRTQLHRTESKISHQIKRRHESLSPPEEMGNSKKFNRR